MVSDAFNRLFGQSTNPSFQTSMPTSAAMMGSPSPFAPGPTTFLSGLPSNAFGTKIAPTQGWPSIAACARRARCGATGSACESLWTNPSARASKWPIVPSITSSSSSMVCNTVGGSETDDQDANPVIQTRGILSASTTAFISLSAPTTRRESPRRGARASGTRERNGGTRTARRAAPVSRRSSQRTSPECLPPSFDCSV